MKYRISYTNPLCHFIDIEAVFDQEKQDQMIIRLPAWRPGRYQLMHFSRNIQRFEALDAEGKPLAYRKTGQETWVLDTRNITGPVSVRYNYFVSQMDGGGSWLDANQLYVNPINCLLYIQERMAEPCTLQLDLPDGFTVASQLHFQKGIAEARDYYHLVDSPFIASPSIRHFQCALNETIFHTWIQGEGDFDWVRFESDLIAFASIQQDVMGPFPFDAYHFLLQFLPYKHYHGVEHFNSTVITLGPREEIDNRTLYQQFLGVCSHELFHAWNVCRMRPAELLPYDFSRENFFETGFIAEGFTTYYGDLFLVRSDVITVDDYLRRLNKYIKLHFDNGGRFHRSLAESSIDLWLDGYEEGTPARKVSIYVKGAIVGLMLDLQLMLHSSGKIRLDDLMRYLWHQFGENKKGYKTADILYGLKKITGKDHTQFFDRFIYGCDPVEKDLDQLLNRFGCKLMTTHPANPVEKHLGIRLRDSEAELLVQHVAPLSPAYGKICIQDRILEIDRVPINMRQLDAIQLNGTTELLVERAGQQITITIKKGNMLHFTNFEIVRLKQTTTEQDQLLVNWVGSKQL